MFYLENPSKLENDLRQILPNYTEFIDYELFTNHMEKLQNSNQIDFPTDLTKISYFA